MNEHELKQIKDCVSELEALWQKLNYKKPIEYHDIDKLSSVIGTLNRMT